ncbi:MAG: ATPase, partial [Thermoplasmata archaeon]
MDSIVLKVAEAIQQDVGAGRARVDTATRNALGIAAGDIVEIIGKKTTAAVIWRVTSEDENKGIIRIDGLVRKNAGVSIGDKVTIKKAETKNAEKVVIAPFISENQHIQFGHGIE